MPSPGAARRSAALRLLGALAIGLLATLPLLVRGVSCGQDFDFHLQSWLAVRAAWHAGVWSPHWVAAANYGAGEPRFLFYPPLSWLLGGLLSFVVPWARVSWAFAFVCFSGTAWSMHLTARRIMPQEVASPVSVWTAAALYTLSPYLLFTGYERGALAELLAAVWIPLLLGVLTRPLLPVLRTAVLLAAIWYTDAPVAVIGCYLVLLAMVWHSGGAVARRSPESRLPATLGRLWLRGIAALALGCALAGDYLFPAWFEQRSVTIRRAIGPGMRVQDSFLFGHTGEPYHDQVLHTASSIAVATFAAGALFAALWWLRQRNARLQQTPPIHFPTTGFLVCVLLCCALLQLPWSAPLWHWLPQLRFVQFPWRLLLPGSAAAALLWPPAAGVLKTRRVQAVLLTAVAVYTASMLLWTARTRFQPCDDEDNVAAQLLLPSSGGFEGTDEYSATGSDNGEIQQGLPRVRLLVAPQANEGDDSVASNPAWAFEPESTVPGSIRMRAWSPEQRTVQVAPQKPAYAVLLLERSADWQVLLSGKPCAAHCVLRDDGLVTVAVPVHCTSIISARFITPWDIWLGRGLTLAALLTLLAEVRRGRRPVAGAIAPL
jgi:hypothetical protein